MFTASVRPSVRLSVCLSVWNQNLVVWKQNLTMMQTRKNKFGPTFYVFYSEQGRPRTYLLRLSVCPSVCLSVLSEAKKILVKNLVGRKQNLTMGWCRGGSTSRTRGPEKLSSALRSTSSICPLWGIYMLQNPLEHKIINLKFKYSVKKCKK